MNEQQEIEFYRKSLERICNVIGIDTPLQLIARAENNEENYVDILCRILKTDYVDVVNKLKK